MTPVPDSRALYLRLLGYVKPYWRMFALSLVALILTAATERQREHAPVGQIGRAHV